MSEKQNAEQSQVAREAGSELSVVVRREDAIKQACAKPLFDLDVVYLVPFVNRLNPTDARKLPRGVNGKIVKGRACSQCGKQSGPYSVCREHREVNTVRRVLNSLDEKGIVKRVTDGRGKKGGALWKLKEGDE